MTTTTRLDHFRTALAHPTSGAAWRSSMSIRPADAIFAPALKVGVAATLVLVAGGLMGHQQLAGIASLGALTSAFGRYQPYRRLGQQLVLVAAALLAASVAGALLGAASAPLALQIALLSLVAGAASHLFSAFRITGPGAVILVFAASAGAGYAKSSADIPAVAAAIGIGAAIGWLVAVAPVLAVPMGPARLATARAIAAVVRLEGNDGESPRRAAATALGNARQSIALSVRGWTGRPARAAELRGQAMRLNELLDEAESAVALIGTGDSPAALTRLARHEAQLRKFRGTVSGETRSSGAGAGALQADSFLSTGRAGLGSRNSLHQGLRIAAAAALSGWVAMALGLGHPLWASMGAVAALQGLNYSMTVQRGIQRLVGNVIGALVAVALLSLSLGFWPSVAMVVVFQVLAELLVLRNYTLTTIAVTPMALIMTGLGSHLGPEAAMTRVADTLVGVVLGVLVAAISISRADRAHLKPAN